MADAGLLRQENTALLRRAMQDGVFSKNELARQTGLSFPTVGRIIDDMVERGEAREAGAAASTGGRCAMRYELDMHYRLFLCLRLEQDTLHWFVCGLDGVPLEQGEETCPGDVRELLDTLLMRVRARYPQLASVAFGFAGAMHDGVVMECFGYPELRGVSLSTHLHDKSGLPSAAVRDMQIVAAGYARCGVHLHRQDGCRRRHRTGRQGLERRGRFRRRAALSPDRAQYGIRADAFCGCRYDGVYGAGDLCVRCAHQPGPGRALHRSAVPEQGGGHPRRMRAHASAARSTRDRAFADVHRGL